MGGKGRERGRREIMDKPRLPPSDRTSALQGIWVNIRQTPGECWRNKPPTLIQQQSSKRKNYILFQDYEKIPSIRSCPVKCIILHWVFCLLVLKTIQKNIFCICVKPMWQSTCFNNPQSNNSEKNNLYII